MKRRVLLAVDEAVLAAWWLMACQSAHLSRVQCFVVFFLAFMLLLRVESLVKSARAVPTDGKMLCACPCH